MIDWSETELSINLKLLLEKKTEIEEFTDKKEWLLNFNRHIFTIVGFNNEYPGEYWIWFQTWNNKQLFY